MGTVEIDPQFETWVREHVVEGFRLRGITVTPTAQRGIAFLMQAQLQEGLLQTPEAVIKRGGILLQQILGTIVEENRKLPLTINKTLHLITEQNTFLHIFPWYTTDHLIDTRSATATIPESQWEKEGQH